MAQSTIAAISTALGEGGIAIIRTSGPDAVVISTKILTRKNFDTPGKLYLTSLLDSEGNVIDKVLAVNFRAPNSYTGEEIVEIHTHGGILIAQLCLKLLISNGALLAEPGEFTRRAFINGKIDLSQAEGVLGIIKSRSVEALKASARTLTGELSSKVHEIHDEILSLQAGVEIDLDFPEGDSFDVNFDSLSKIINDLEELIARCEAGMLLNHGTRVVIAGKPNAGKSSLLNALLGRNRAIVTEIPGTTRDIISENLIINGLPVNLSDTAGLRDTDNIIEAQGVKLALDAMNDSDICLYVIDGAEEFHEALPDVANVIVVINKSDLKQRAKINAPFRKINVSAKNNIGIDKIKAAIYEQATRNSSLVEGLNASSGQLESLRETLNSLTDAINSPDDDITAGLLNSARVSLLNVLGIDVGDELLNNMFSRFCVGK